MLDDLHKAAGVDDIADLELVNFDSAVDYLTLELGDCTVPTNGKIKYYQNILKLNRVILSVCNLKIHLPDTHFRSMDSACTAGVVEQQ